MKNCYKPSLSKNLRASKSMIYLIKSILCHLILGRDTDSNTKGLPKYGRPFVNALC